MSGYYRQSRNLSKKTARCSIYWASADHLYDFSQVFPQKQTTTSFRSGGVLDGAEVVNPDTGEVIPNGSASSGERIIRDAIDSKKDYSAPYDTGHEFRTERQIPPYFSHKGKFLKGKAPYFDVLYKNVDLIPSLANYGVIPEINLIPYGTQFINSTIPTKPIVDLPLMELQILTLQEFPRWVTRQSVQNKPTSQVLGELILNGIYGWGPFVRDLQTVLQAVGDAHNELSQYVRDGRSGRTVRRRRRLPTFITDVDDQILGHSPSLGPYFEGYFGTQVMSAFGNVQQYHREVTRQVSLVAEYQYYVHSSSADLDKSAEYAQKAQKLLGSGITPKTVWDSAPWSWLLDWFADIGPIIGNAVALADGLVIKYAYAMCKSIMVETYESSDTKFYGYNPGNVFAIFTSERKERIRATPFGFGLNPNDFSLEQWTILGALGMSNGLTTLNRK